MDKNHIIKEIQRTAKENGGMPLGRLRFSSETGIKMNDLLGKHWVRWSEALAEAGFQANKFQGALDESILFEKYIKLVRVLGHLPVEAELRLHARKDDSLPNSKTYQARFKSKLGLIQELNVYCSSRSGYEDVVALCKDYIVNNEEGAEKELNSNLKSGYVYLFKMGRSYKIGKTFNPIRREGEIILQLPEKSEPIHYIQTDDPSGIEKYWHMRFADKRKEGEWFALTSEDIRAFKRWKRIS